MNFMNTLGNSFFNANHPSCSRIPRNTDALETVRRDPAVLEARITLDPRQDEEKKEKQTDPTSPLFKNKVPEKSPEPDPVASFKDLLLMQQAALLSLTPHQFELIMNYADTLRKQRLVINKYMECAFCKNNGEPVAWYSSHILKDRRGRVRCPVLRAYRCPCCGATGDYSHTIKYCPENTEDHCRSGSSFF